MAYDPEVADRVRAVLPVRDDITEKAMFGGLAFLIGGNMAIGVRGGGGLMVRSAAEDAARLIADRADARQMTMRGRVMTGWVDVSPDGLGDDETLQFWVDVGVGTAAALPPK